MKVLTQNLNKGFTLLELIFGMSIMLLIGGFTMNAVIEASNSFSNDKKTIDSSQNLSAILEMIGNDIKQSGENISNTGFPVVQIQPNNDFNAKPGSSKITIRRALTTPLTLCENIAAGATTISSLVVADNSLTTIPSCNTGTPSTNSNVLLPGAATATALAPTVSLPPALMAVRNYRCEVDDLNPKVSYDSFRSTNNTDFCLTAKPFPPIADRERLRGAIADPNGTIWTFDYINESVVTANQKYRINIGKVNPVTQIVTAADPAPIAYTIDTAIYVIEEREYTLDNSGFFYLKRDGGTPEILMSGIAKFNISARVYGDKNTKAPDAIDPASTIPGTTNILPLARRCPPVPPAVNSPPYYICTFKAGAYLATDDWKTLQGIKIELQASYDSTGRAPTEAEAKLKTPKEIEKLSVEAEFFPRNVLSR